MIDRAGTICLVNTEAERLFDYSHGELIGQKVEILIPERFRIGHVGLRDSFLAHSRTCRAEEGPRLLGRRKDGTEFPIEICLNTFNDQTVSYTLGASR